MASWLAGNSHPPLNNSSEQDAIKRLARLIAEQDAWSDVPSDEQNQVIELSRQHLVFPLLYQAIEKSESKESPVLQQLSREALHHKARSLLLARTTKRVNRTLKTAGIPALWFKGIALAYTLYSHPWLRFMVDVDLLVPYDQSITALDKLRHEGFINKFYESTGGIAVTEAEAHRDIIHHFVLYPETKSISVELHYDFAIRRISHLDMSILDWFWDRSQTVETQLGNLLVPDNESGLLLVAMHDFAQHQKPTSDPNVVPKGFKLLRKYDIHLLISQDSLDWDTVFCQARAFGWLDLLWASIKQTHAYFGTPTDLVALERELRPIYDSGYQNGIKPIDNFLMYQRTWTFLMQLSLSEKLVFLWKRVLFIPEEKIREIYKLNATQTVWPYHVRRITRKTVEVLRLILMLLLITSKNRMKSLRIGLSKPEQ